jgi:hypothetical protein
MAQIRFSVSVREIESFESYVARRFDPCRHPVGPLIFEFSAFNKCTFPTPSAFIAQLHTFLRALPAGFRDAVEIRNAEHLGADYLEVLASQNVAQRG